jgi:hypothetical protein
MAENAPSINLLPKKGESFLTQFLNWTLSIGRLLIILTEIVALATFLYRFTLDMQIVDLNDKIKGESFIVENFEKGESNFRDLQDRLAQIDRYDKIGSNTTTIFRDITQMGRGQVTFKNLTVDTDSAKIDVQAPTSAALSRFVQALKANPAITAVNIDKVENNTSTSLVGVSITVMLKPAAFDKPDTQTFNTNGVAPILNSQ